MKQKTFYNSLLRRLAPTVALALITTVVSLPGIAEPTDSTLPTEQSNQEQSKKVSELLNRLKEKNSSNKIDEINTQTKIKKIPEPKPETKKKRYKPTIKTEEKTQPAPKPVQISSAPAEKKQKTPRKKISLPELKNFYVRADYGMGWPQKVKTIRFKKSSMYGGGVGYNFNQALRADVNFQIRKLRAKSNLQFDKIQQYSLLLNGYLNLMDESSFVVPYLTVGVGYTENKRKGKYVSATVGGITATMDTKGKTDNNIVWNAGCGTTLRLTKNIAFEATYKYIDFGKIKGYTTVTSGGSTSSIPLKIRLHKHEIVGGLIFNF